MDLIPAQCLIMFPENADASEVSFFISKLKSVDSRVVMFHGMKADSVSIMISAMATGNIVLVNPQKFPDTLVFQIAVLATYFKIKIRTVNWDMSDIRDIPPGVGCRRFP